MKLTQDEKRIKIAESCGTIVWSYALPKKSIGVGVPDYFNDLNAMHEAEKCTALQAVGYSFAYVPNLMAVVRRDSAATYAHLKVPLQPEELLTCCIFATAAQRAEAFGITLNLWAE